MLKRGCNFYVYCARLILSTISNPIALQFILILSSHLVLDLKSDLFPSDILTKSSYAFVCSCMHTICPSYLILLNLNTRKLFSVEYKSWSPSLCNCLRFPITYSLLCPNILYNTFFFITLLQLTGLSVQPFIKTDANYDTESDIDIDTRTRTRTRTSTRNGIICLCLSP
jgi:hypothetical protein